ncbi:MAG: T9SS type A sorting domain-containing protein, partial [candidate division WOR-3 bacterium]
YTFRFFLNYNNGIIEKNLVIPIKCDFPLPSYISRYEVNIGSTPNEIDYKTAVLSNQYFSTKTSEFLIPYLWDATKSLGLEMSHLARTSAQRWNRSPINGLIFAGAAVSCPVSIIVPGAQVLMPVCVWTASHTATSYVGSLTVEAARKIIDELPLSHTEKIYWKQIAFPSAQRVANLIALKETGGVADILTAALKIIEFGVEQAQILHIERSQNQKTLQDSVVGFTIIGQTGSGTTFCYSIHPIEEQVCLIRSFCPVDLILTDPNGRIVAKDTSEIPNAHYIEADFNYDGSMDDEILIPYAEIGQFQIQVIPETSAVVLDSFTLVVDYPYFNRDTVLAQGMQIRYLPPTLFSFETFANFPPDTFSLITPLNDTIVSLPVILDWNDAIDPNPGHVTYYDLILSSNPDFTDSVVVVGLTESQYILKSLLFNFKGSGVDTFHYYWKVRAYDLVGADTFSNQTGSFYLVVQRWQKMQSISSGQKNVKQGGTIISIADSLIFAFKGNNTQEFYAYDILSDTWVVKCTIPKGPNRKSVESGAALSYDGLNYIYALKGNNTLEFWRYNIETDIWERMKDIPGTNSTKISDGAGLVFVQKGDSSFVFCLKGSNTTEFYAYFVQGDTWLRKQDAPLGASRRKFGLGSCVTYDGNDTIYALKGRYNEFYAYSITNDNWTTKQSLPKLSSSGTTTADNGASMTFSPYGIIYAFKGGNTQEFWAYDVATNTWAEKETIPKGPSGKKVGPGGSLCYAMGYIFALKGNNTVEFWRYTTDGGISDKTGSGIMTQMSTTIFPFMLYQNIPNPFKSKTTIRYSIPNEGKTLLLVYDVSGRLVKTLVNENKKPGYYMVNWNRTDNEGRNVSQGVYLYVLKTADNKMQKKMLMLR